MCESNIEEATLWNIFTTAEQFGIDDICNTYDQVMEQCKSNYIYLTALAVVLNRKCWYWYDRFNPTSKVYESFYYYTDKYAKTHLKDDELSYYYDVTD